MLLLMASPALATSWGFGTCPLPPALQNLEAADQQVATRELVAWRDERPAWFAPSEPPARPRVPADFEPKASLHVVFPVWPELEATSASLIAAALEGGPVTVHLMGDGDRRAAVRALRAQGVRTERVSLEPSDLSSLWIRDYGGIWTWSEHHRVLVDPQYFADYLTEDAWPSLWGPSVGVSTHRMALPVDGGNLLSDGHGTCFTSTALPDWAERPAREVAASLDRWFGCRRVVFLEALEGEETQHVDVLLSISDPHTLLLAEADVALDPVNHARLERHAAHLASLRSLDGVPYRVLRVPLAPPTRDAPVRSYLNLVPYNQVVLVPAYEGAGESRGRALAVIRAAFPTRRVREVPADGFVIDGGAIHCVTWTEPAPE